MSLHSLRKRFELLEKQFASVDITLTMADGSKRKINSKRLLGMMQEVFRRGPLNSDTQLLIDSASDDWGRSGRCRTPELIRVMAAARASVEQENREQVQT